MFVLPAVANDTLATLGAGGLVPLRSAAISMEREDLEISTSQIRIRYRFRNHSNRDVSAVVAFPLPELEGGAVEHVPMNLPSHKNNFVDFEVRVAGKILDAQTDIRAFHDGREITAQLRAAGLPLSVIDNSFESAVQKLTVAQRKQFEKDELIVTDDASGSPLRYWANWNTRVQFYWTQRFPAKSVVEVEHRYRPVVGGAYMTATDTGAERIRPYCGGADALTKVGLTKQHHPVAGPDQPALFERRIQYILTTANNWSGPIGDFHLTVVTADPDDIVLTCFPGLKQTSPTRYELQRTGFHPERDLDLLILTHFAAQTPVNGR